VDFLSSDWRANHYGSLTGPVCHVSQSLAHHSYILLIACAQLGRPNVQNFSSRSHTLRIKNGTLESSKFPCRHRHSAGMSLLCSHGGCKSVRFLINDKVCRELIQRSADDSCHRRSTPRRCQDHGILTFFPNKLSRTSHVTSTPMIAVECPMPTLARLGLLEITRGYATQYS
jgi:hypothetical protein